MTAITHPGRRAFLGSVGATAFGQAGLSTKDWPQWRGRERLGLWTETGILDAFPEEGLTVMWRVPINGGFSGPAVADGRVFVLDRPVWGLPGGRIPSCEASPDRHRPGAWPVDRRRCWPAAPSYYLERAWLPR